MKFTEEKRKKILTHLKFIRLSVEDKVKKLENSSAINSCINLRRFINQCNELEGRFRSAELTVSDSEIAALYQLSNSLSLREVFQLIEDVSQGKVNALLQDALDHAEIQLSIDQKDPLDPDSRKVFNLHIQIAATVIDKYAGLLEIALNQSTMSKEQQKLIHGATHHLNESYDKLQRARLSFGLKLLAHETERYIVDHKSRVYCCGLFSKKPSSDYKKLTAWFASLAEEPLSSRELAGAIYLIRAQLNQIKTEGEREALRDCLDQILKDSHYPEYCIENKGELTKLYTQSFLNRLTVLELTCPAPFKTPDEKTPLMGVA